MITLMCERRCAAVLALALMAAAALGEEAGAESDDESDSAPFTVAVEHGAGSDWRCSAALLSLRTALTSARCARGPQAPAPDVWAHATQPGVVPAATRVLRIALDAAAAAAGEEGGAAWGAAEAAHDVALLELAEALGGARPILLAAGRADCVPPRQCYAVRALSPSRLRIVELELRAPAACWPAVAAAHPADGRAMCLAGPALCRSERGAGVVCGGKLCGVLSASLGSAGDAPRGCGAPHVAGSAPRWRRFLHCAHTRGACGRDGECAQLCSERWLEEEARAEPPMHPLFAASDEEPEPAPAAPAQTLAPAHTEMQTAPRPTEAPAPTRTPHPDAGASPPLPALAPSAIALAATPSPTAAGALAPSGHHALEFDPNRQDFTMRSSSVPTRVVLKAGEYGGAADYLGAAEEHAPASAASAASAAPAPATASAAPNEMTPAVTPATTPTTLAREQLAASLEAQISSNKKKSVSAASAPSPLDGLTIPLSAFIFFIL